MEKKHASCGVAWFLSSPWPPIGSKKSLEAFGIQMVLKLCFMSLQGAGWFTDSTSCEFLGPGNAINHSPGWDQSRCLSAGPLCRRPQYPQKWLGICWHVFLLEIMKQILAINNIYLNISDSCYCTVPPPGKSMIQRFTCFLHHLILYCVRTTI